MTEIFFVLTVIFVAYVFYVVINDKKNIDKSTMPTTESEKPAVSVENSSPEPVVKPKPAKKTQVKSAKTTSTKSTVTQISMETQPEPVPETKPAKKTQTKPAKTAGKKNTTAKVVVETPIEPIPEKPQTPPENTASEKTTAVKKGLKNPQTGEIVTTYSNYIFTKRWIKEALVSEGLLEKVYKNNELNAETEAAIKAAIAKLEALEQYKA